MKRLYFIQRNLYVVRMLNYVNLLIAVFAFDKDKSNLNRNNQFINFGTWCRINKGKKKKSCVINDNVNECGGLGRRADWRFAPPN